MEDDCRSILLILMIIQTLSSRHLKYSIIVILENVDFTTASLPTTYSVSQIFFEWFNSFRVCSLSKIFEALATIYVDTGWLHVEDGGICGPDLRICQLWQPLFKCLGTKERRRPKNRSQMLKFRWFLLSADGGPISISRTGFVDYAMLAGLWIWEVVVVDMW